MTKLQDTAMHMVPAEQSPEKAKQLRLETRIDRCGILTYHSLAHDTTGGVLEKIYDHDNRLLKVVKRQGSGKSETYIDPATGQRTRVTELATMPDGNLINSDIVYHDHKKSSQIVTIFKQNGQLVRITERESRGSMVTFQAQTDYDVNGTPSRTINQHTDAESGLLMHRELIHWIGEGLRAMTEHFFFDVAGHTVRYTKSIHHSCGTIFSEETQLFDPDSQRLERRELAAYDSNGRQTCLDVLCYDGAGKLFERHSTFFDQKGNPIVTRKSNAAASKENSLFR
jgi:hypothetical protein